MNNVQLKGRLTKDIELRTTKDGKNFCFFTVACDRPFAKNTDFVECRAWGDIAASCSQVLHKGDLVSVVGYIGSSSYEKDGKKVYTQSVMADDVAKIERSAVNSAPRTVRVITEGDEETAAE